MNWTTGSRRLVRAETVRGDQSINHVCESKPWCKCVGGKTKWDECDCTYAGFSRCKNCGATMVKIDISTGEPVLEHCLDLS